MAVVAVAGPWLGSAVSAVSTESGSPLSADCMAVYQSAIEAFKAGRRAEALPLFERVADRSIGYLQVSATNMVGQIQRLERRYPEALASFSAMAARAERELQLETGSPADRRYLEMLRLLAICYQAEIHECRQSWPEAIRCYERIREMPDSYPQFAGTKARLEYAVAPINPEPAAKWGRSPSLKHSSSERILTTNDQAKTIGQPDAIPRPALAERLGRLYWRIGEWDKSRAIFEDLLAAWPTYERAPAVEMALVSLANSSEDLRRRKLVFLGDPLVLVRSGPTDAIPPEPDTLVSPPSMPPIPDPVLQNLDGALSRVGPDSPWRAVLLMRKGWTLFEMDRVDDAMPVFAEVKRLTANNHSASTDSVRHYAGLSEALCLRRKQRFTESIQAAQEVVMSRPQGHLRIMAGSLIENLTKRQEATEAGARCPVTRLK